MKRITLAGITVPQTAALAPMASVADTAYRLLCREHGACMVTGELVSAKGLCYGSRGSAELCGSDGIAKLIAWAKDNYDYVLIDTPPMSAGADAESLADLTDASVLIVRQNWAEAKHLQSVIDVLDASESKFIGCVLNDCWASAFSEQSGYGYGYGYGRYGRYGKYGKYGKYGAYGAYAETQKDNS